MKPGIGIAALCTRPFHLITENPDMIRNLILKKNVLPTHKSPSIKNKLWRLTGNT